MLDCEEAQSAAFLEAIVPGSRLINQLRRDSRGTSAIEYGLILGFIVFALMVTLSGVAQETLKMWTFVETESAKAHKSN